jgi:hypothetical protein
MASNATLTIKVGANVKDAAQQLQALGYKIETVKKKTDKANDSASLWSQTMKKGSEDSVRKIVEMGAKFLTVSTVITGVYKGIKSCVSEALNENEEAQKKIDAINTAWTGVQKNLGNALLDSITPALEDLYEMLLKLEEWTKKFSTNAKQSTFISDAAKSVKKTGTYDTASYSLIELEQFRDYLGDMLEDTSKLTFEQKAHISSYEKLLTFLDEEIDSRKDSIKSTDKLTDSVNSVSSSISSISTLSDILGNYSTSYNNDQEKAKLRTKLDNLKGAKRTATGDELNYYTEAINNVQSQIDSLNESAGEVTTTWQDAFSEIYSSAKSCFSGVFSFMDAYYDRQIKNIEDSEASEEEKNAKINELEKKQFEAQQANSYANATISFAEGMIDIWSKYGASPWIGAALTALLTANTGLQFATISQQTYTPSLAEGGIVTSPTHAYIGEGAEHEAVIPLSKLEDFVNRDSEGGAIYLNITCNGNSSEADVFRAIERAQRTGLLPHWRYA